MEAAKAALATGGKPSHIPAMVEAAEGPGPYPRRTAHPRKSAIDIPIGQYGPKPPRTIKPRTSEIGATVEEIRPSREIRAAIKEQTIVMPVQTPGMPSPAKCKKWENVKAKSEVD